MTNEPNIEDYDGNHWIDLLSNDELPNELRAGLWKWLDADAIRWKRCALALLETREFESALAGFGGAASNNEKSTAVDQLTLPNRTSSIWRRIGWWGVSLSAAFLLGMFLNRGTVDSAGLPIAQSQQSGTGAVKTADGDKTPVVGKTNVAPSQEAEQEANSRETDRPGGVELAANSREWRGRDGVDLSSPYFKRQLEKRGFELEQKRELVSVSLPDGRKLQIPVNDVLVSFRGGKVY